MYVFWFCGDVRKRERLSFINASIWCLSLLLSSIHQICTFVLRII
uniref:Uncharacterized protein n=1 Tax=Rhizophora mucronata TaxID=61149 RepID=A0A2P2QJT4_RHIMU